MKLACHECGGSGRVTCPTCAGRCVATRRLDLITIPKDDPCHDELVVLQKDAKRVVAQCAELKQINPQFAAKYDEQMVAVLDDLDRQAEKVVHDNQISGRRVG